MTLKPRLLVAEGVGTALLVFFGCGVATLSFGYHIAGLSISAGVVATALTFGLVLMALVYAIGPVSGCHINPAVTLAFLVSRRIAVEDAIAYWIVQVIGAIVGAGILYAVFDLSTGYNINVQGLGANGYGASSFIHANAGAAFIAEVILTFIFTFAILAVTRTQLNAAVAGLIIGLTLTLVHIMGIPIDGTSVNPARSIAPALFVGGSALTQLWLFILAPLVGGFLCALAYLYMYPVGEVEAVVAPAPEVQVEPAVAEEARLEADERLDAEGPLE